MKQSLPLSLINNKELFLRSYTKTHHQWLPLEKFTQHFFLLFTVVQHSSTTRPFKSHFIFKHLFMFIFFNLFCIWSISTTFSITIIIRQHHFNTLNNPVAYLNMVLFTILSLFLAFLSLLSFFFFEHAFLFLLFISLSLSLFLSHSQMQNVIQLINPLPFIPQPHWNTYYEITIHT